MAVLVTLCYVAAAVFAVALILRCVRMARMPVHLRWELYPVAHEPNAAYGGSFLEQPDWGRNPSSARPLGDLRVMVPEILFLSGVRRANRTLWWRSYPFHMGLYLLGALLALLTAGAVAQIAGLPVGTAAGGIGGGLAMASIAVAVVAFALLTLGASGLGLRRLGDAALRAQSAAADFVHLAAFAGFGVLGLAAWALADRELAHLRGFVHALLTVRTSGEVPALVAAEIVMGVLLVAYIPLTHMSHFFTKWFLYHHVRWDDEVNRVGGKLEATLARQLGHKVSWSASHIAGGGTKTWAEVATDEVAKP